MSNKHEIRLISVSGNTSKLFIGDQDVSANVTGLSLEIKRNAPQLTLDIIAFPLDIHLLQVPVRITEGTHDLLVQLGWTPPPEPAPDPPVYEHPKTVNVLYNDAPEEGLNGSMD